MKLEPHDRRRVAVEAQCDPRSVVAFLDGKPLRPLTASRIRKALGVLGIDASPQPADGPTPQPEAGKR